MFVQAAMKGLLIGVVLCAPNQLLANHSQQITYEFEDYYSCLSGWESRGDSWWECIGGALRPISSFASLRNKDFDTKNGSIEFSIEDTLGRGEAVVWLRNHRATRGMARVRIIFEERADIRGAVAIRVDQQFRGRKKPLLAFENNRQRIIVPSVRGSFRIDFQGPIVQVTALSTGQTFTTSTDVVQSGHIYLTSTGGEGGYTDFGYVTISSSNFSAPTIGSSAWTATRR